MVIDTELYDRFGVSPAARDYEIQQSLFWLHSIDHSVFLVLRGVIHVCFEKVAQLAGV
jgi:hypothetical protein